MWPSVYSLCQKKKKRFNLQIKVKRMIESESEKFCHVCLTLART